MTINEIRNKWRLLPKQGGKQVRVSKDCLPDLFLGLDEDSNRRVVLWIKKNTIIEYQNCHKEKISIEYYPDIAAIQLKLNDDNFLDLFDDLILSIINHIQDVPDTLQYPKAMFTTFHKWSEFFVESGTGMLKPYIIQGIWGELFILNELLMQTKSTLRFNTILSSWKGPYKKGHDFETDITDIEVKTKEETMRSVKISSEVQLQERNNQKLVLIVLSVRSSTQEGKSLNDLYQEIKGVVQKGNGDISILLKALRELKLDPGNLKKYDNFRYTAIQQVSYDCTHEEFPRYTPSILRKGVSNIKYDISLPDIKDFIKEVKPIRE